MRVIITRNPTQRVPIVGFGEENVGEFAELDFIFNTEALRAFTNLFPILFHIYMHDQLQKEGIIRRMHVMFICLLGKESHKGEKEDDND
jgi:hypothetical protein